MTNNNINPNEAWATLCNVYPLTIIEAIRLIKIVLAGLEGVQDLRVATQEEVDAFISEFINN